MDSAPERMTAETMHIGEFAEHAGMSQRTIRHYDGGGLLVPSARTAGGFRVYTESDLQRLLVIRRMKPLGFSLEEMSDLLEVVDALATTGDARTSGARAALAARLDTFIADAERRHAELVERVAMAEEFVGTLQTLRGPVADDAAPSS